LQLFAKIKQQRRLTAAFSLTAWTVLTRLTALTADRIDHVDIVDGQAPMRPSTNEVKLVNNVRCQYRQCRQYGQSRPNSLASAAGGGLLVLAPGLNRIDLFRRDSNDTAVMTKLA
jgi:hypothetical protein